jgi:hypothetical protein
MQDSNTEATSFNHNWRSKHPTKLILDFLESLRTCLQLSYYHQKVIKQLARSYSSKTKFFPEWTDSSITLETVITRVLNYQKL